MHETCTKAVKEMPQCKNSLANCANLRAVAGMSITDWKQGCNMAVTGCQLRNFELNVTGMLGVFIYTPGWRETCESKVSCPRTQHSAPESGALTISPQRLPHSIGKMRVIFRNHIRWTVILDFWALTFNARIDSDSWTIKKSNLQIDRWNDKLDFAPYI